MSGSREECPRDVHIDISGRCVEPAIRLQTRPVDTRVLPGAGKLSCMGTICAAPMTAFVYSIRDRRA